MSSINQDLARAMVEDRRHSAEERRLVREVQEARRRAHRAERAVRRRRSLGTSVRRLQRRLAVLSLVPATRHRRPEEEVRIALDAILHRVAESVVEHGTVSEGYVLHGMAAAAQEAAPGASAALVDWDGAEIARLRAYGIVHGVVMDVLEPSERAWLLDHVQGTTGLRRAA